MNLRRSIEKLVALVLVGVMLAACGGPSDEQKAAAEQQAKARKVVKKVQPADPLAGMSSAVTGTKGTLPVDVRFELLDRPEVNKPVNVRLAFVPAIDLYALRAMIKPVSDLQIADDAQVKFESPRSGEIKEYKFVATPTATGILLVTIDVIVTRDTGDTTFTFSLAIPVPDAAASTSAAVASTSSKVN